MHPLFLRYFYIDRQIDLHKILNLSLACPIACRTSHCPNHYLSLRDGCHHHKAFPSMVIMKR